MSCEEDEVEEIEGQEEEALKEETSVTRCASFHDTHAWDICLKSNLLRWFLINYNKLRTLILDHQLVDRTADVLRDIIPLGCRDPAE